MTKFAFGWSTENAPEAHSLDATANKVCRAICDAIQILRRFPESGKIGIEQRTRELAVPRLPYVVTYRLIGSEAVEILRVWHGAQERLEERPKLE
jgi:plasmid stabilization system protein ParE